MSEDLILNLAHDSLRTTFFLAGPLLFAAMGVGIIVSVIQAITQINESTLSFIPKMVAVVAVLVILGPWMLETLENYTQEVFAAASSPLRGGTD